MKPVKDAYHDETGLAWENQLLVQSIRCRYKLLVSQLCLSVDIAGAPYGLCDVDNVILTVRVNRAEVIGSTIPVRGHTLSLSLSPRSPVSPI